MNLLADECVPHAVVERLRADGHVVASIGETRPGIRDEEVLALALTTGAPLLTIDMDFGELVFRDTIEIARCKQARVPAVKARVALP